VGRLVILMIKVAGFALAPFQHHLFWRVSKYFGSLLEKEKSYCTLSMGEESCFRFYLDDPYWNQLLSKTFSYEPELAIMLTKTKDFNFVFIDCGANFGYWSIFASAKEVGAHEVVAIESSPQTFQALTINWDLNGRRFHIVRGAVSSQTGAEVEISKGRSHAGAHIGGPTPGERTIGTVSTITIDDVLLSTYGQMPPRIMLKLDVEGYEIAALEGGKKALLQDCLICYEDHGKDRQSEVSKYVMTSLKLAVFFVHPNGSTSVMHNLDDINRIKMRRIMGTNFFACRRDSAFFNLLDHMSSQLQVARVAPDWPPRSSRASLHRRRVVGDRITYIGLDVHKKGIG
jgi:FkbM family methyltransferase